MPETSSIPAIEPKLRSASPQKLQLDPKNPRLGRVAKEANLSQDEILKLMKKYTLDELALSFLDSGFWPQEPLIAVKEQIGGQEQLVVVEGNRRLAAIRILLEAKRGVDHGRKWKEIAESATAGQLDRLKKLPYMLASSRKAVENYLGFRHVTGIKEWDPAEKAEFVADLLESGQTYQQVMRLIGSRTPWVRQNYIAYRLLRQMEDIEGIDTARIEERFSVLFLSLRTEGIASYLGINTSAGVDEAKKPVDDTHLEKLKLVARLMFGHGESPPFFTDSRLVDQFGLMFSAQDAREYLERTPSPVWETAMRKTGGAEGIRAEGVDGELSGSLAASMCSASSGASAR